MLIIHQKINKVAIFFMEKHVLIVCFTGGCLQHDYNQDSDPVTCVEVNDCTGGPPHRARVELTPTSTITSKKIIRRKKMSHALALRIVKSRRPSKDRQPLAEENWIINTHYTFFTLILAIFTKKLIVIFFLQKKLKSL